MTDEEMEEKLPANYVKLASATLMDVVEGGIGGSLTGGFYMPKYIDRLNQAYGQSPEKMTIPETYHAMIRMCYDFYIRGGIAGTVIDRLAELSVTDIRNGGIKAKEPRTYFEALLCRKPSRLNRFIHNMSLEYYLTGMVLPRVQWKKVLGKDFHPDLTPSKEYLVPTVDMYPALLTNVEWAGWGEKAFYLTIPPEDWRILKNKGGTIKSQQARYNILSQFSLYMDALANNSNKIQIDTDAILRKEISLSPYPTPYLSKVLEALIFKQQLRRMDFAVASRIVSAILLVQEGDKDFPVIDSDKKRLTDLQNQILGRANNPILMERLFTLFSNHTTKLTWVHPDVEALLNQDKYRQANDEIMEGLGFPRILIVGESRGAQAAEVSTWAIRPQMEEFRDMVLEWLIPVYEEAADLNGFRNTPEPSFAPIQLQDFVKTAAVFAQAYREGNISRTTRDQMIGLDFDNEIELMTEEHDEMATLPTDFKDMPYNVQVIPQNAGGVGSSLRNKSGGRQPGTKNTPLTPKNSGGIRTPDQQPISRTSPSSKPAAKASLSDDLELWSDEKVIDELVALAEKRGIRVLLEE